MEQLLIDFYDAPAHDVEGDVPLENMLAMIELVQNQPDFVVWR